MESLNRQITAQKSDAHRVLFILLHLQFNKFQSKVYQLDKVRYDLEIDLEFHTLLVFSRVLGRFHLPLPAESMMCLLSPYITDRHCKEMRIINKSPQYNINNTAKPPNNRGLYRLIFTNRLISRY